MPSNSRYLYFSDQDGKHLLKWYIGPDAGFIEEDRHLELQEEFSEIIAKYGARHGIAGTKAHALITTLPEYNNMNFKLARFGHDQPINQVILGVKKDD